MFEKPSQLRKYIESPTVFPQGLPEDPNRAPLWGNSQAGIMRRILSGLEALDPRLLTEWLSAEEWTLLKHEMAELEANITAVQTPAVHPYKQKQVRSAGVVRLHSLLAKLPDEASPHAETRLAFIDDPELREDLAKDIDSLGVLLGAEQWKAATVIGGAVIEGVLLHQVQHHAGLAVSLAGRPRRVGRPTPSRIGALRSSSRPPGGSICSGMRTSNSARSPRTTET